MTGEFTYDKEEQEIMCDGLTAMCVINNGFGEGTLSEEQVNILGGAVVLLFNRLRKEKVI